MEVEVNTTVEEDVAILSDDDDDAPSPLRGRPISLDAVRMRLREKRLKEDDLSAKASSSDHSTKGLSMLTRLLADCHLIV